MRRAGREGAIFTLYLLVAIALTWPLATHLSTAVSDQGDPLLNAWILDWTCHALVTQPLHLFDAPMFHPSLLPLAYSEHMTGIALLVLPFHLAGLGAMALHNLAMLLGFALSGYGAFVLSRMFVGSSSGFLGSSEFLGDNSPEELRGTPRNPAAFIAGIFYAFVSFKFDHLPHLQIISSGWIPLTLAALVLYWRHATPRNAMLFAGAFVMNGLTNIYYLLFVSAAVGMTLVFLALAAPKRDRRFWLPLLGACIVAGVVLLPFLFPYRIVSKTYGMKRQAGEVISNGWTAWLVAPPRSLLYGKLAGDALRVPENSLFPGVLPLFLIGAALLLTPRRKDSLREGQAGLPVLHRWLNVAIVVLAALSLIMLMRERFAPELFGVRLFAIRGSDTVLALLFTALLFRLPLREWIARSRFSPEAWLAVVWTVVGFFGAFGMHTFFYTFLYNRVEPFQSIRAVSRFAVVAYAGMSVFVAIGAALLIAHRGVIIKALLVALAIVDVLPAIQWEYVPPEVAPVYRALKEGPVLELPIVWTAEVHYLLGATHHRVPLLNGFSGFEPPQHIALREAWDQKNISAMLAQARQDGAKLLIVHDHLLEPEQKQSLYREIQSQGMSASQHFEGNGHTDLVFRLHP
jgi:hypothetical protein